MPLYKKHCKRKNHFQTDFNMNQLELIQSKIYEIRGQKVMLDKDLAELYQVTTGNLNKAVKRNMKRFPPDFMFQLTTEEWEALRFQNGIIKKGRGEHTKYLRDNESFRSHTPNGRASKANPNIRTGAADRKYREIYRRSVRRPERHQRRHTDAIGANQPNAGRASGKEKAGR